MFREMTRIRQQLAESECIEILKNENRGVLSVLGDDGYPYGMPMNHYYCEEDGKYISTEGRRAIRLTRSDDATRLPSVCMTKESDRRVSGSCASGA